MIIKANAKINLTLDITGVREDGFHTLRSVMVPVSLSDELIIEKSESMEFHCNIPQLETDDNLCIRAAKRFLDVSGINENVSVTLNKNIPFPAGLGGGSADAAAVLKGMNELFDKPLSELQLFAVAETLGSDVPLCLLGKAALCEGRGEILTPLSGIEKLNLVIAIGKARLSTPEVYRKYDSANLAVLNDSDIFLKALEQKDTQALIASCGNAFEPVTDILAPETKVLRSAMMDLGALNSHLSGSGPSVYGIFNSRESASVAAEKLKDMGYSSYLCETI